MKRILFVSSSLNGRNGASSELGTELVSALIEAYPGSSVTTLDLNEMSLPHLDAQEFASWSVPAEDRTREETQLAGCSDFLIEQLLDHDTLVLGVPMYNMSIPSTLKAWIDRIVRAGRTFRYTSEGPIGLTRGIDAYAVFARGGMYRGTPMDTQTGYLQAILGLIGIDNLRTVFAEGLAMGKDNRHESIDEARDVIASLAGDSRQEVRYASS